MKEIKRLAWGMVALLFLGVSSAVHAAPGIVASNPWIELVDESAISQPGYLMLENKSDNELILVRARSSMFDLVMIHQATIDRGDTRMMLKQELLIPAGKKIELSAKGVHLMFAGRKGKQKQGDKARVTLVFSDGSQVPVEFEFRKPSRR
jgi:copper(I)-binding protein